MRRGLLGAAAAAAAGWVAVVAAFADVVQVPAARDNTLYEDLDGRFSNGAGDHLFAGRNELRSGGLVRRGLLAFDIAAAVPPGATITRVELTLNMSRTITGPATVRLHRVLRDWGEGESDAPGEEGGGSPAEVGDATWIHTFFDSDFWGNEGGDFDPTPSAGRTISGLGKYTWPSTQQMVANVQGWLDNPPANFGWVLVGDEQTLGSAKRFDTHENPIEDNRPVLAVEFTPGACTGNETLTARCKDKGVNKDLIKATVKNARDGQSLTFRLDSDPNTDVSKIVRRGKATAKFKRVADGDHVVEVLECPLSKQTTCR